MLKLVCACALLAGGALAAPVYHPPMSRMQECNANLATVPSALDAMAASLVELTNALLSGSGAAAGERETVGADTSMERAHAPRSFARVDSSLDAGIQLQHRGDSAAPVVPKKCPPITFADYQV